MALAALETKSDAYVSSIEREQIARDLHDGVLQSLIATELQIDHLRRRSSAGVRLDPTETLANVQEFIRTEVRKLRGQIEQLRSNSSSCRLVPCLTEMIEEFQHETGIVTSLACDVRVDSIPRRLSREIFHIVEEALTNVRRHSGAQNAEVCLSFHNETLQVVIQDDGRGFGFTGRASLAQLEAMKKGPRIIRERVHSMNGEFVLESDPVRGARLEVRLDIKCGDAIRHTNRDTAAHEETLTMERPIEVNQARLVECRADLGSGVRHVADLVFPHLGTDIRILDCEDAGKPTALVQPLQFD